MIAEANAVPTTTEAEHYRRQRVAILEKRPQFAELLPPEPPPAPAVRHVTTSELHQLLAETANNHASMVMVVGWGDGTVPLALLGDPTCRQKRIHVLLLPGEDAAFAHTLTRPVLETMQQTGLVLSFINDPTGIEQAIVEHYNLHEHIPQLAGADFIDRHPLIAQAETFRSAYLSRIYTGLCDRPQAYGNDIIDSFTGMMNAARNARILLPAPTISQMTGFFGQTPIISIAAGPSLKRRLDHLRALQDRCILVACDAVLHGLLDAGIDPHFVTPLERVDSIIPMLTRAGESRSIYAGLPVCPPQVVQGFGSQRAISLYCGDRLYPWLLPDATGRINTGLSTGVLSVTVACALGTGSVYLVGHDLARDEQGSHWDGAQYASNDWKKGKATTERERAVLSGYEDRMVPGNDGGLVPSITWWDRFRAEIGYEAGCMRTAGRAICNPNAHDRIFARIDHTEAAPLPDPASLPPLAPWSLPERDDARLRQWQDRARKLPEDGLAFRRTLTALRDDIAAMRRRPPAEWDVETLGKRVNLTDGVSEGNRMAFAYFLRSALHNYNAEMHLRRRTTNTAHSRWTMLTAMDDLCQALTGAMDQLQLGLEEVAREHA